MSLRERFYPPEYQGGWHKDSIVDRIQPEGGRGLERYEQLLRFQREELHGSVVLDLGVGPDSKFSQQLKANNISSTVVGMSPDFYYKQYRERIRKITKEKFYVAGLGQQMPFADESFDRVFMLHVFEHLYHLHDFFDIVSETARVLKKGGKAHFGPSAGDGRGNDIHVKSLLENKSLTGRLASDGVSYTVVPIPVEYFSVPFYDPDNGYRVGETGASTVIMSKSF